MSIASIKLRDAQSVNRPFPYAENKPIWRGTVEADWVSDHMLGHYRPRSLEEVIRDCEGKECCVMDVAPDGDEHLDDEGYPLHTLWVGVGVTAFQRDDGALCLVMAFPSEVENGSYFSIYEIDAYVCLFCVLVSQAIRLIVCVQQNVSQRPVFSSGSDGSHPYLAGHS